MEFSIDTDSNIPFDSLDCSAYDLGNDISRKHKIRPILIGPDGISKNIAIPFLTPLTARQRFCVLLKCALPGCMQPGFEYYTSTLSFAQGEVPHCTVRLKFRESVPAWVRVYECAVSGSTKLLKDLQPATQRQDVIEYLDIADNAKAQSARIYVFWRAAAVSRGRSLNG